MVFHLYAVDSGHRPQRCQARHMYLVMLPYRLLVSQLEQSHA